MYDLHTHTYLSDGVLGASELVQRYEVAGYKGVVLADHVDAATIDSIVPQIVNFCKDAGNYYKGIEVIAGCELTHVPVAMIKPLVDKARSLGAKVVIVHGETIVEPVPEGTNREAILGGADILAHPGLIKKEDVSLAKEKGVALEITSRSGHSYTNGHVVRLAKECGAELVYSSDFHAPHDLLSPMLVRKVLQGASLSEDDVTNVVDYTETFFKSKLNV